ncbi:universal stress protein [Streptomyces brevispora]|uniref:Nucleotide-binding universal stress UspA family protein n=1 Tax=Streptomyces brevispora TaxID=887462 RepID=A0A561UR00_9ACTN|nr:universal stress protein [Streptomyces brevispora]TWG01798.1 nucleotide-binding universal stress UspA family protein [Streptomyces brevispora]WSC16992.1 universal stress protein [Streptomyces brevispora]
MKPVITVGLDGTPESLAAADWAAREAVLRGATLHLLHAWVLLSFESTQSSPEEDQNYWAKQIVDDARATIEQRFPDLPIIEDLVREDPRDALRETADASELLVLGSRDMAPLASYFLGDVGLQVMARSPVPTILVRAREHGAAVVDEGDVVVGLSLHGPCDALVDFAFESAARRDATLRAVHGVRLPVPAYTRTGVDSYISVNLLEGAQRDLSEALRPWRKEYPRVRVEEVVRTESPARAVVRGASGAGLLVVGRRQEPPPLRPWIGPVLQAAVHHASCPVAVVPHK